MAHIIRPPLIFLALLSLTTLSGQQKSLSGMTETSLNQAMKQSSAAGKLLFIFFYADWVQPCRWMKESTFADQDLRAFFSENVVFLEVNVESQSGSFEKVRFNISALPTMILFDASGNQLTRIEEALDAKKLRAILNTWNNAENRRSENNPNHQADESFQHLNKQQLLPELRTLASGKEETTYGIVIKYFYQYEHALPYWQKFQSKLEKKVSIYEKKISDELIQYQIVVSKFSNQDEARAYLPQLSVLGIRGDIIKF